jgi:diguanylate cyclase (GGDEF)-like protein
MTAFREDLSDVLSEFARTMITDFPIQGILDHLVKRIVEILPVTAYLVNAQARADLQESSDQSREAALHDPLTGLPNRVLILQLLEHAFRSGRRTRNISVVFFLDLDKFKEVNDTYGHQVGDELLIAVAERLTGILRPGDSLARLSGDEFVILCENLTERSEADPIAVRLSAVLSQPFALAATEVTMRTSIGIAFSGEGGDEPEDLLRHADLAMYQSKRTHAGTHDALDLRELHLAGHQAGLARSLPGALQRGELHLDYQPIVDARDGRVTGAEALLRWDHSSRGAVSPTVFIPFAEQSGQITELGQWVLEKAWSDRSRWQAHGSAELGIWIDVSAHQFMAAGFADGISRVLRSASGAPGLLTLEVTESVFVRDEQRALIVLGELKKLGVKLAHGLGMTVVSEGVETMSQRDEVIRLGTDCCQGFYFASPDDRLQPQRPPPATVRRDPPEPPDPDVGI